ncbi:NUDIX hydrolase [Streptomyces sp. BH097]|uniref:NUDIX hydrolase n=1 Tax=unclassified Streptomyces TaxID=2593676 RepID=UPI003BB48948
MTKYVPPLWPVSVKGVALDANDRVLLLKNERDEWELPGGRLEIGGPDGAVVADDSPQAALEREIQEETGWEAKAGPLVEGGVWIYEPVPGRKVLIVTYGCTVLTPGRAPVVSSEHKQLGMFTADEVPGLTMPEAYKQSIAAWYRCAASRRGLSRTPHIKQGLGGSGRRESDG